MIAETNNCVIATILPLALATQTTATANSFAASASAAATTTTTTTIASVSTSTSTTTTSSTATTTSIRAVPIALGTFSSLEHYYMFPSLLSTFLTFEQNLNIILLFGQHLSTFFFHNFGHVSYVICLRNVFSKPSTLYYMKFSRILRYQKNREIKVKRTMSAGNITWSEN